MPTKSQSRSTSNAVLFFSKTLQTDAADISINEDEIKKFKTQLETSKKGVKTYRKAQRPSNAEKASRFPPICRKGNSRILFQTLIKDRSDCIQCSDGALS